MFQCVVGLDGNKDVEMNGWNERTDERTNT